MNTPEMVVRSRHANIHGFMFLQASLAALDLLRWLTDFCSQHHSTNSCVKVNVLQVFEHEYYNEAVSVPVIGVFPGFHQIREEDGVSNNVWQQEQCHNQFF